MAASIRRFLSTQSFKLLPRAMEVIKPDGEALIIVREDQATAQSIRRWEAVYTATQAIIATTTPGGRWRIITEGMGTFYLWAKAGFPNLSHFSFDANELRVMFEGIDEFRRRRGESRYDAKFAARYQETLHKNPMPDHRRDESGPIDVGVDSVYDGGLRQQTVRDHREKVH